MQEKSEEIRKFMWKNVKVIFSILLMLSSLQGVSQTPEDTAKKEQKTVYLFSGIGADSSIFMNLKLPGYHKVYINWIPALPKESLTQYASRIKSQITVENPYIIGLSFGGIIAVEVSKQIRVEKMVLISSVRTRSELNKIQFFFMKMGLYHIIPGSLIKRTNFVTYRYFGARSPADKKALTRLLLDTDVTFFRWALRGIAYWYNKQAPQRTIQINGTADRVITSRLVHPDYRIKGGGHLMILDRADTIGKIITNYFGE
jgi:pimeloyl-ACP methyl ester carboxylesterase